MPKPGTYSRKSLSPKEWHKELLFSWLFRTCFKLQASLDRRFLDFGTTFQEAAVLMRCVEGGETVPSRLAITLGKDKGKMTRLVDRLEAAELVKRLENPRDRRYSVIKATPKGKRLAKRISSTFEQVREELFMGVLDRDIQRLSRTLPQLHRNALEIGKERPVSEGRRARRIGEKKSGLNDRPYAASMQPSVVISDHLIPKVREGTDERLVQGNGRRTERKNERGAALPAEVVLSR